MPLTISLNLYLLILKDFLMQPKTGFCLRIKPTEARFYSTFTRRFYGYMTASILLFAQAANSQDSEVQKVLQLEQAINLTLAEHPDMDVFSHQRSGLGARVKQASFLPRPVIGLTIEDAMGTGEHSNFGAAQSTLNITWVLEQDVIKSRVRAAKKAVTQVDFELEIKALDVAAQTAKLFIQSLVFEQRLQLAKLAEQQAKRAVDAITRRLEAGKSSAIEKLQAEAELVRRELEVEDLMHELYASRYQLVAQWGGNANNYSLKGDLLMVPVIDNLQSELEKLNQHPALLAFANQQRIAESEIELARIEAKPKWQVSAGIRRYQTTDDFGLVAGISIPWGSDKGSLGQVQVIQAQQAKLQSQAIALSRKLNTQLFVLLQNINHSKHVIDTLTDKVIPLLEQASAESSKAYEIGKIGYLQWTTVRQELLSTQSQLLDAYQAIHLQHIEIQRLTGVSVSN
jgi:cobalt-zinc-cadmium efflux system outer membrane protein